MTVIDHPTRTTGPKPDPEPNDPEPTDPAPAGPAETDPAAAIVGVVGRVLLELDPRRLRDNPHNPRTDLGDLSELTASLAEAGVLEPLIVAPDPDDPGAHVIVCGHRRRAAAVEAGLPAVPCDVREEYAGKTPEQVADMLSENLHRLDLTGLEEAAGYAQLAMFDWTPDRIARRVGRSPARVQAGLAAVKAPAPLRPKLLDGELTLEQAAALEDFAGEPKAYERLLRTASTYPAGLHHALADERHKQDVAFRTATTRRGLVDDGVRVVAKPRDFPWSSVEVRLSDLSGPDGQPLTRETHASCPGHAAFLESNAEAVFLCQHPKDWGHGVPASYRHRSREEVQAAEEAAQAARERDEAMAVAAEARLSWLAALIARKGRAKPGTLRLALSVLAAEDTTDRSQRETAGRLVNPEAEPDRRAEAFVEAVERSGEARLPLLALAYAAGAGEGNLRAWKVGWRFTPGLAVLWLNVLEQLGYPVTEVEAELRTHWATQPADDEDGAVEDTDASAGGGLTEAASGHGPVEPDDDAENADGAVEAGVED